MPEPRSRAGDPSRDAGNELPTGDREAVDRLFSQAYEELRRLAAAVRRSEASVTLNPTALVHEAWLKLADSPGVATSPLHFKRIAARAMRQVLIEAARRRVASKRGGGTVQVVTLDDSLDGIGSDRELLALDEALAELEQLEPRQGLIVESRFFGGLSVVETAELLDVSEATVLRDWRAARAWLGRELRGGA
jgi:RNA polymerase sigma-70 factor, ECF subfamily